MFAFFRKFFLIGVGFNGIFLSTQIMFAGFFSELKNLFKIDIKFGTSQGIGGDYSIIEGTLPNNTIGLPGLKSGDMLDVLVGIQSILVDIVLPLVVIGSAIYIAYEFFTADGDEGKMKKAMKSFVYSAIALIAIGLSYVVVYLIRTLSF